MEEIKVGEYIRTKDGIRKLVEIYEGKYKTVFGKYLLDKCYKGSPSIAEKNIGKHSFNILDLIEVGDYVNGHKVYESDDVLVIFNIDDFEYFVNPMGLDLDKYRVVLEWQDENYIKNVVTKEQFESIEYKVGE